MTMPNVAKSGSRNARAFARRHVRPRYGEGAPVRLCKDNELACVRDLAFAAAETLRGEMTFGKRSFLARIMADAKTLLEEERRASGSASAASAPRGAAASEPWSHVDLQGTLKDGPLKDLGQPFWPRSASVDALDNEVKKLQRRGVRRPFVYTELKKFLPTWAEAKGAKEAAADEGAVGTVKARSLTFSQWLSAFEMCAP